MSEKLVALYFDLFNNAAQHCLYTGVRDRHLNMFAANKSGAFWAAARDLFLALAEDLTPKQHLSDFFLFYRPSFF